MRTRRQTATPAENGVRRLFREAGFFQVEAVSSIRSHNGEFMSIVCFPSEDVESAVRLVTDPRSGLEVTRIHIGHDNGLNNGRVTARVYVGWEGQTW